MAKESVPFVTAMIAIIGKVRDVVLPAVCQKGVVIVGRKVMSKLVSIWKEKDIWQTYSKKLNIEVMGNSEKQALLNFFHFLVKDYLVYKYTPKKKMSKGAKKLLKVYGKFIDEKKR